MGVVDRCCLRAGVWWCAGESRQGMVINDSRGGGAGLRWGGGAYQVSLDVIVGIKALIPFCEMMFYC